MQVIVVIVMNVAPQEHLGTATSSATFFRSIGGSFGVAIFGAIFNSRLLVELPRYLPESVLKAMHRASGNSIASNPKQLAALPPEIHQGFVQAFGHSLTFTFLFGVPFAALAFLLTWFIPEAPLRDRAFISVGAEEGREAETLPIPDEVATQPA
jgi:hypothetical protein